MKGVKGEEKEEIAPARAKAFVGERGILKEAIPAIKS